MLLIVKIKLYFCIGVNLIKSASIMSKITVLILCSLFINFAQAQDISVVTQQKNNGSVEVLCYSSDGRLLATGGKGDFDIKVWDVNSSKIIGTLSGHDKGITDLVFNKEGDRIISTGEDHKALVWNITDWTLIDSVTLIAEPTCLSNIKNGVCYIGLDNGMAYQLNFSSFNNPQQVYNSTDRIDYIECQSNHLLMAKKGGILSVYDLTKKSVVQEQKIHPLGITGFDITLDHQLITAGQDGKILIWNLADLSTPRQIKTNSMIINSFDHNPAKSIFAISTPNKTIKIFDYNGQLVGEFKGHTEGKDTPIKAIKIAPNGSTIASSGMRYSESLKGQKSTAIIQIWDIDRGIIHKTLAGEVNPTYAFDFHPKQNKLVILGEDHMLTFWDLNFAEKYGDFTLPKPKREIPPKVKEISLKKGAKIIGKAIRFASGDMSATLDNNRSKSLASTLVKRNTTEHDLVAFSSTGKYLITKLKHDEIRQYDFTQRKPEPLRTIFAYQPVINRFMTSPDDNYIAVIGSGDSAVSIVDLNTGSFIKKLSTPLPDALKFVYEAQSVAFSPDGKYLAVCFNTSKAFVWRTSDWQLAFENILPGNIGYAPGTYVNFTENSDHLIINTYSGLKKYNTKTFDLFNDGILKIKGHALPINKPCNYTATIKDNYLYFENLLTSKVVKSIHLKPKMVAQVSTKSNGKIGITLTNGQFFIINPETGEDDIMIVSNGDNSIIKTYENYYKVNKQGFDLVTFRIGNKAYPFEQFDAVYNRPDLVLKKLDCDNPNLINLYNKAHLKRIKKLGISNMAESDLINVPTSFITNSKLIPAVNTNGSVSLDMIFKDQSELLSYNIWVNNVPLYGKKGQILKGMTVNKPKVKLNLSAGINKIQVACRNKAGFESLLETVYVNYNTERKKQNIYLVTIGTSKYVDADFNLNYAAKDANDLSKLFQSNPNHLYGSVNTKTLFDEDVTVENVMALKSFIAKAGIDDIVIVFVAGHGVLDENFDYYFATNPMDFQDPKKNGLAYESLESLLDGITAKRKILIMDTCHSGEVDKEDVFFSEEQTQTEEDVTFRSAGPTVASKSEISPGKVMNELFNDLRRGTGATVLSSAGGTEFALESDEWKNGLFSYCLLTGLKNRLADLDKNGEIHLRELQTYVVNKVKALSHGKQIPNSRIQNLELDFQIW